MNPQTVDVQALQQEVQVLRGRILQLEADAQKPLHFVEFVGDAYGHSGGTMEFRSGQHVALQLVGRSAHFQASQQYEQWVLANPSFVVVSKRLELVSHPIAYNGQHAVSNVSAIIHVTYRTS
jgi:hypothetical protein